MTESREFYGATVEEAVEKAAASMDVPPGELVYEVVDPGSGGFLGIGARDARIQVSSAPAAGEVQAAGVVPASSSAVSTAENYRESAQSTPERPAQDEDEVPVSEELLDKIREFMAGTLDAMDLQARVEVYDAGDFVAVDVSPEEAGLFIGQKGETIDSIQHLVNVFAYKDSPFVKRIILDSEGYRQRRLEAIQGMAHRMARRAAREKRAVELPPMSPAERRIVHLYLKENTKVTTASEGSGENRRVRILPAR